jgi:Protein of unknown function (DUF3277)
MAGPYSFLSVQAGIVGPGVVANLGTGAAVAEEGITIAPNEDKNSMIIGADGQGQHTLIASNGGILTLRYLKTSITNGLLQLAYNLQKASSSTWGQNIITVADPIRLELTTAQACAFQKKPEVVYDKAGPMIEWVFQSISITTILGLK